MLPISEYILQNHLIRRRRRQKDAFIAVLQAAYPTLRIEENGRFRSRNLILGDPETAKVLLTAHYDTPPAGIFPNLVMPYRKGLRIFYTLLVLMPLILVSIASYLLSILLGLTQETGLLVFLLVYYALFFAKMFLLPPNRKNCNDNTSGILTLLEIWETLSDADRAKTALVFFDHEEYGCVGSKAYYEAHRDLLTEKLLLNFDCVGDGDHFLFVQNEQAEKLWQETLQQSILPDDTYQVVLDTKSNASHSSDHKHFPCGVAVSAMHDHPRLGLHFSRIHTHRDIILQKENIRFLQDRVSVLIQNL